MFTLCFKIVSHQARQVSFPNRVHWKAGIIFLTQKSCKEVTSFSFFSFLFSWVCFIFLLWCAVFVFKLIRRGDKVVSSVDQEDIKAGTVGKFMEYNGDMASVIFSEASVSLKVQDLIKCTV